MQHHKREMRLSSCVSG